MLKIIFFIKSGKTTLNGESPIFARITLGKEITTMSTGKSITAQRWIATQRLRAILKLEKEKVLKKSLELFQLNIEKKYNSLLNVTDEVSISMVKDEVLEVPKSSKKV